MKRLASFCVLILALLLGTAVAPAVTEDSQVYTRVNLVSDIAGVGIGRDHRIPLAELACMSPKRRQELANRLGGKPGRAPRIKSAHVRRPLFRPGP